MSKYYYNEISLYKYCKDNFLNYSHIVEKIKDEVHDNPDSNINDIIKNVVDNYNKKYYKYYYKNIPLKVYCVDNNYSYDQIRKIIKEIEKLNQDINTDEIVNIAVNKYLEPKYKYYYNGISLKKYCSDNDISYQMILRRINKLKIKYNDLSIDEIVIKAIEEPFYRSNTKYFVEGISLKEYCNKIGFSYSTIMSRIHYLKSKGITSFDYIYDESLLFDNKKTKLYYNKIPLKEYCETSNLSYINIYHRIYYKVKLQGYKNIDFVEDEILDSYIKDSIESYKKSMYYKKIRMIFEDINKHLNDELILKKDCKLLSISWDSVMYLKSLGYSYVDSIKLIWYFSDDEFNKKLDTKDLIIIENLSNNISDLNSGQLFKLYKCNILDTRLLLSERYKNYIYYIINNYLDKKSLSKNKDILNDIYLELQTHLLYLIERCNSNNDNSIHSYFLKSLEGYMKLYINYKLSYNNYSIQMSSLNYEDSKFNEYDRLKAKTDDFDAQFDLKNALLSLTKEQQKYIHMKYNLKYSDDKICKKLNKSTDELDELKGKTLSILKKLI